MFTRFTIRNLLNINNSCAFGGVLNVNRHADVTSKPFATEVTRDHTVSNIKVERKPTKTISKAMKMYLERSREYNAFMERETIKYELGKRHLANMMGEDPESFDEAKIQQAIKYLFPSGIYDKKARPIMAHPTEIFGNRKEAAFDESGRPFHFLFYTTKPKYTEILYNIAEFLNELNEKEDKMIAKRKLPAPQDQFKMLGYTWLSKEEIESKLLEIITEDDYNYLIKSLEALVQHPLSAEKAEFVSAYRKLLHSFTSNIKLLELQYDSNDRPFVIVTPCKRKTATGEVKVIGQGSGNITINGKDIFFFQTVQCREQIIFPLIFTDMAGKVDIEATVSGGGPTGQSGAIRWGIAYGLRNFVDSDMIEKMRIAGLLTKDVRRRERKKYGQEGARRKFTWKKR
ncbi:mitochondrial ribosomal protein S9 [Augochlora pura]